AWLRVLARRRASRSRSAAMCCATRAATSFPTMGGTPDRSNTILATGRLLRRFATRCSRRIGLRISGEIEKNAPADANGRPFAGNGKGPPGGPQNFWVPFAAIGDVHAIREVGDRMDGRVPQAVTGDADGDPITVRTIVTGVKREGDKWNCAKNVYFLHT